MTIFSFVPLSRTLPYWPRELFGEPGGLLDEIGITDYDLKPGDEQLVFTGTVAWLREIELKLPALDSMSVALLSRQGFTQIDFEARLAPDFELALKKLEAALRVRSEFLRPVKLVAGKWEPIVDASGAAAPAEIVFTADAKVTREGDVALVFPQNAPALTLPALQLGDSGIVLEMSGLRVHLSEKQSPPAGAAEGFKGVAIDKAKLHVTGPLAVNGAPDVEFKELRIGSSGFSGEIHAKWPGTRGHGTLFGVAFDLESLDFTFSQNVPVDASLKGKLTLPFFEKEVAVEISVGVDGKLSAAITNLGEIEKSGILKMALDSIRLEAEDGVATFKLAGKITPLAGANAGLKWPSFDVDELSIDTKGNVSIDGGWVDLPKGYTLDLRGFKLEITKFGAGRDEQGRQYIGFNGGLDLIKGIPAGASVEGLRISWGKDNVPQLAMRGVGVEVSVKDKLHFKGEISYDDQKGEFKGAITLELPALHDLALDGKIVFGTNANGKYAAVYFEGDFGNGVPLWATGLDLTGIAGLFAVNYAPDKTPDMLWYSMDKSRSWFHKPPAGVTDILSKWKPQAGTMAVGAGVTLATGRDDGFLFNGKFILLLLFPGPVCLLQGQCDFMEKPARRNQAKEPALQALIVLDARAGYFLIGLDAKWKYEKSSGKLAEIAGSAEAYFDFHDPLKWRIDIGKKTPLSQRIRATFAGALQANAYFGLNPQHLALGVWIGKSDQYTFGPVRATLEAWLDANAELSFKPAHLKAGLWLHGALGVKVLRWGFLITLDARLEADVARPFHIVGSLTVAVETRFKTFEFEVRLEWGPQPDRPLLPEPFKDCGIAHLQSTIEWRLPASGAMQTVPMDGRPYITFEHPVHDLSGITVNPSPNPGWITVGRPGTNEGSARVRYTLTSVQLTSANPLPQALYGAWAAAPPNPTGGGTQNRLMLFAKSPFEVKSGTAMNNHLASSLPNYPCPVPALEKVCVDWEADNQPREYQSPWTDAREPRIRVSWDGFPRTLGGVPGVIDRQTRGLYSSSLGPPLIDVAYVANQNDHTVSVIDVTYGRAVGAPIAVGAGPLRVAVSWDGSYVFVANFNAGSVSVIEADSRRVVATVPVQGSPAGIAVHPRERLAYVTSYASKDLTVIDFAQAPRVARQIALPELSYAVVIDAQGTRAYVSHPPTGAISVIDLAKNTVVGTIAGIASMLNLALSPDGRRLYVPGGNTAGGENIVALFDTSTLQRVVAIEVGKYPAAVVPMPDGSRLYVANGWEASVSVVSLAIGRVVLTIPVGGRPLGAALSRDGRKLFVTCADDDAVTVIDTTTNTAAKSPIPAGDWPEGIAMSPRQVAGPSSLRETDIELPEGTSSVELLVFEPPDSAELTARVVLPEGFATQRFRPAGNVIRIDAKQIGSKDGILKVRLHSNRHWILLRICIVRPSLESVKELTQIQKQLENGVRVWGEPAAVLAPDTEYTLKATVTRRTEGLGALSGWVEERTFPLERRFRSGLPPGLGTFTKPPDVAAGNYASGLDDLTRYVGQTIPATLPPIGEVPKPRPERPVFRAYDRGVQFDVDYIDRMYELAARDLAVRVHDADNEPVRDLEGSLFVFANRWANAAQLTLTETEKQWIDIIKSAACLREKIDPADIPLNRKLADPDHVLEPDTLYEARIVPLLHRAAVPGAMPAASANWSDVLIQVRVRPPASGAARIAFRGGYALEINTTTGRRKLAGTSTLGDSAFAYDPAKSYLIVIEAIGSRIRVAQDGVTVFDVTDTASAKGTVVLTPLSAFQDLAVHDFTRNAPVVYSFKFTTSRYVDHVHQINGYGGETWKATLPADYPAASIVAVPNAGAALTQAESRAYDAMAGAVLPAAANPLPRRLEVTQVQQGSVRAALLVRSDEPIDFRRTGLAVGRAAAAAPTFVPAGQMKVLSAEGTRVDVLLNETLDPSGARIQTLTAPRALPESFAAPLLADRFAQNDLAGWTLVDESPSKSSAWSTANGELLLRSTAAAGVAPSFLGTLAAAGAASWTDIALTVRMRCPGGGTVGLVVRAGGAGDYYRFSMDSKRAYRQLVKKNGGVFTVLWRDGVAYDPAREYELALVAEGETIRGFIDGVPTFVVSDASRPAGAVALYVWNGEAYFSGVRVTNVTAREWMLDERMAQGMPATWSYRPQPWQAASGELIAPVLAANAVATAVCGDPAWTDYRVSARLVAGGGGRTSLLCRFQDDGRHYALRVDRAAARLRFIRVAGGVETLLWERAWTVPGGTETLFTLDCLGATLTGHADGVQLFRVNDATLANGGVAIQTVGNTGTRLRELRVARPEWTTWYTFGAERRSYAGTRIEIGGTASSGPVEPGVIRRVHPRAATLPAGAVDVRICDAHGNVQHARRFLPASAFVPVSTRVMRNTDGTGFFILPPVNGAFAPGTYRLTFDYDRVKTGLPTLSRGGSTIAEKAVIDVVVE